MVPRWYAKLSYLLILCWFSPAVAQVGIENVHITEVYFCHPGGDDGYEWVELTNFSETLSIDLTGAILATGGFDYGWSTIVLDGVIPSCGRFVVGGPFSEPANGSPAFQQTVNFDPDIQNGGPVADGVALFAAGTVDVTVATPLDVVIYGEQNTWGLPDETGSAGDVDVPTVTATGLSIERVTFLGTWDIRSAPDPGETRFSDPENAPMGQCSAVAVLRHSWGAVKGRF